MIRPVLVEERGTGRACAGDAAQRAAKPVSHVHDVLPEESAISGAWILGIFEESASPLKTNALQRERV